MIQRSEIVISKTPKRRGLEGIEKVTNGLAKALEGVEGFFCKLSAREKKRIKYIHAFFYPQTPSTPSKRWIPPKITAPAQWRLKDF
ncbi:MAG: hypothetical protein BI182_02080 [Acetobacterium sp. MES1]|nr:MAG: hypothetical protein BI182_02080 [Acetobacterium sp. MES1]